MPSYRFRRIKEEFYKFLSKNRKLKREAVLEFYNKSPTNYPALSTLYKWYNARY